MNSVVDHAIFLLDPHGRVASWSVGAERLHGYRAEEIVGRHFSCLYDDKDRWAGHAEELLADASAEGHVEDQAWRVANDGSRFWADVVITTLHDWDESIRGFAEVTRDGTERKRREDSLRNNEAGAWGAVEDLRQRGQAKDEFLAMVAHDLGSPLTIVAGFAELLGEQWEAFADADRREMLGRIQRTAEDLAMLVADILATEAIETGELAVEVAPFDLAALVRRAGVDAAPPMAPERIRVNLPGDFPPAVGDEGRTWQVLMNLLSNGLKFSGPDSPIDVTVSTGERELVVAVRDRGPGIALEDRDRVFERFVSLPRQPGSDQGGSGLGLYIAKALIEAQQGRLWIGHAPDRGAVFYFSLPSAGLGLTNIAPVGVQG